MVKKILPWVLVILLSAFLIIGFAMKDKLNNYLSEMMISQASSDLILPGEALSDSLYNYSKNKLGYEITFLEFGSKGCSACKRMESVLNVVRQKYPEQVNVVFLNVLDLENQVLMKYFGIATIPSQILLNKEGKEVFRHTGYYSAKELSEKLTLD